MGVRDPLFVAVVDDDASICRSLTRLLRAAGIQSVAHASAEEFLRDTQRRRFDCVLLDVRLSGMSGLELQERLGLEGDTTPLIFITAHDDEDARERALRGGCFAYFRKTAPGETILAAIRSSQSGNPRGMLQ
jgi:FixJ family two-component response regulator